MKIAWSRRKWLNRNAALEQARLGDTKVELKSRDSSSNTRMPEAGIELNHLLRASAVNSSSTAVLAQTLTSDIKFFFTRVGAVLGLIPRNNRRSHYSSDNDPNKRAFHPAALSPFETNPEWVNTASAATFDTWGGYGRDPAEDGSTTSSGLAYQSAIQELVNNPIGGIRLKQPAMRPWSWNAPTTGGLTMSIFGMGFGWNSIMCSEECLDAPNGNNGANCPLKVCNFLQGSIGDTMGEETVWTSDSSLSMVVPPGIGAELSVNITTGRFKQVIRLFNHFSYDAPSETGIAPSNSPLLGNVSITVYGSNFGSFGPRVQINIGESRCTSAIWNSDSQVVCSKVIQGTGSLLNTKVRIESRPSESPQGISRVFSYNRPEVLGIYPGNGPPSGYSVITLLGKNFGFGPNTKFDSRPSLCPQDSPGQFKYILNPRNSREAICGPGFLLPVTQRFNVKLDDGDEGPLDDLRWDNIRPYSLAYDPVACVINEYLCTYKNQRQYCQYIPEACMAVSNKSVQVLDAKYADPALANMGGFQRPFGQGADQGKWYTIAAKEGGCANLPDTAKCPPRRVSTYLKDGVTCDYIDQSDPMNPEPYFFKRHINVTDYLCNMSPRPLGGCSRCSRLGCCNKRGTYGARISGTGKNSQKSGLQGLYIRRILKH